MYITKISADPTLIDMCMHYAYKIVPHANKSIISITTSFV